MAKSMNQQVGAYGNNGRFFVREICRGETFKLT